MREAPGSSKVLHLGRPASTILGFKGLPRTNTIAYLEPSLIVTSEARSLPLGEAPKRCSTRVALDWLTSTILGYKGLPRTNTIAYLEPSLIVTSEASS